MAKTIITKFCNKCKTEKHISEFYPRKDRPGGFRPWCKACCSKENKTPEHKELCKRYSQSEAGKASTRRCYERSCTSESWKQTRKEAQDRYAQSEHGKIAYALFWHSERGRAIKRKGARVQAVKHPLRLRVRWTFYNAVRRGLLPNAKTLSCCMCWKPAEQYHHWHSYTIKHTFDVISVCRICHNSIHNK